MAASQLDGWDHPFCRATVTFALDVSQTTDKATLKAEATFVKRVVKQLASECQKSSHLILCDSNNVRCVPAHAEFDHLRQLENLQSSGPARPGVMLQHDKSIDILRKSTIWFLMTDGDITPGEQNAFTQSLLEAHIHGTTLVSVKFGDTDSKPPESGFELAEALLALCPNYLSLFYDKRQQKMRVMHSKGVFETMLGGQMCPPIDDATTWEAFPTFRLEQLNMISVPAPMLLAADEVLLADGFNTLQVADLLTGQIDSTVLKLLVVGGDIDKANFKPVRALAQTKSESDEIAAWASQEFWDYDDFRLLPRVDEKGMARSAFLALSTAISEHRDQDHVDRLRGVLRQANHHNLINFNSLCRDMAKLRGEVIVTLLSQPSPPRLKIGGPPKWVRNIEHLNNIVPANMGWTNLFWNGEFVADHKRPFVTSCTICGKEDNTHSVLLLTKAGSLPAGESKTAFKAAAEVQMEPNWLWEVVYATGSGILCTDTCCCDACSVQFLSHGFGGIKNKPVAIWPIARFDENQVSYQAQLEQVFGSRFEATHALMAFLSVLVKVWKDTQTPQARSSSGIPDGGSSFAKAVFRAICHLLEGIQTDFRGLPMQDAAQEVATDQVSTEELSNTDLTSSSLEPDDKPVLGKVYTGRVSIVWKTDVFVTLQNIKGNPSGRIDMGQNDDALWQRNGPSPGMEVRVKVVETENDAIELSMKDVNQSMNPVSVSRHTTEVICLGDRLRDGIRQVDGRRCRSDCLLDRLSLRAFALAFEAACIAIGEGITSHLWARGLRLAALKRYLFCLFENIWANGLQNQKRLKGILDWINRLIVRNTERPETMRLVVSEEELLSRDNMDIIRGLSVFNEIEGVLGKATVAVCQGMLGLNVDALEAIPTRQWTVMTVFTMVLQSPEVTHFWEAYEQGKVDSKENHDAKPQPALPRPISTQVETTSARQAQPKDTQVDLSQMEAPQASDFSTGRSTPQRRAGWGYLSGEQRGLAHSIHAGGSGTAARQTSQRNHGRDDGRRITQASGFGGDYNRRDGDVAQRAYASAQRNFSSVLDSHSLIMDAQVGSGPREAATAEHTGGPRIVEMGPSEQRARHSERESSEMDGAPAAEAWW
ncbi:hypothetical protein DL546_007607 [Coniochaeta pulveracea]|uniref:S1 motif domain-containing protein n=1 Tax=Coniochaeta pulveracea TaxID=177199 RepID=A0A420YCW2_9PEZI|nr:hypothetical protein DL546_007607 [Coniochaeta pulveracea]